MIIAGLCAGGLLAGCGGGPGSSATVGGDRPQIQVEQSGTVSGAGSVGNGRPLGSGGGAPASGARGGAAAPGASPGAAGGVDAAAALAAAQPGSYPASYSATSEGGPPGQPGPSPCPTARLAVGPASQAPAGVAQNQALHLCNGGSVVYDLLYPSGAGLEMTRATTPACAGGSFVLDPTPPLEVVPGQLAAGAAWGPVAFTAPAASASGTVSGRVLRQAQDNVGGTALPVWVVDMLITIDRATVCGVQISGRIDQTGDWAPSLRLFPATASTDTFQTPLGTISTTSHTRLLSTTPS